MSAPSVGYASVEDMSFELILAQVRMSMQLIFDILPLSKFNHLVGNGCLKVWTKWTAQTVVLSC